MTTLLLVRHGETDWNSERRWQGHADEPLNETGRAQAREVADELADRSIDAVYSSDLSRARETAEIIAARLGLSVTTDARLREVDVGDWSGRLWSEIEQSDPLALERWHGGLKAWNGGESYEEMGARVVAAVVELAARHQGETVLVVSHGGSMRACRASAAGLAYHESREGLGSLANCAVVELTVAHDRLVAPIG
ncbi:MAG TPA: histidine phosphatase family protein [Gaiellaceae bacterium]|nr:histidine phosphatase family protein [Gaiellaceae bacterium]